MVTKWRINTPKDRYRFDLDIDDKIMKHFHSVEEYRHSCDQERKSFLQMFNNASKDITKTDNQIKKIKLNKNTNSIIRILLMDYIDEKGSNEVEANIENNNELNIASMLGADVVLCEQLFDYELELE